MSLSNFIKGVPMKLTDKFQPLPSLGMVYDVPLLFPESVLEEEMDLSVENRAIDDFMNAQKKSQTKPLSESCSSTSIENETTQNDSENEKETDKNNSYNDKTISPPNRTLLLPSSTTVLPYVNGISSPLQPVPVDFSDRKNLDSCVTPTTMHKFNNSKSTSSLFKLEDFETNYYQSSPFDAVELKTLNVFEELRQVLQGGHHGQTVVVSEQQTMSSPPTPSSLNGHRHFVHNLQ